MNKQELFLSLGTELLRVSLVTILFLVFKNYVCFLTISLSRFSKLGLVCENISKRKITKKKSINGYSVYKLNFQKPMGRLKLEVGYHNLKLL